MKIKNRTHIVNLKKISTVAIVMILILFNSISQGQGQRYLNKESLNDWTRHGLNGKVNTYDEVTYDAIDRFGKIEKGNKVIRHSLSIYSKNGNRIQKNTFTSDGSLDEKYIYTYDDQRYMIEKNIYKSDGSSYYKLIFTYDEQGHMIEKIDYSTTDYGSIVSSVNRTYKYDGNGNMIEEKYYDSKDYGYNSTLTYKYDVNRNMIEKIYYTSYFSEREGYYIDKEDRSSWQYEYDEHNNWTKKISFYNGFVSTIKERKYRYYE